MASVTIIPVCCPLSLQGNESILSQQRAGVDLSIWTKELVQFFVRSIYRKVPYKQLHVLTAHLCKNQASAREQTWRGEHTVICDLSNGNRLARRLVDLNRKFAVLKKSRKAYQSWLIPPPHTQSGVITRRVFFFIAICVFAGLPLGSRRSDARRYY